MQVLQLPIFSKDYQPLASALFKSACTAREVGREAELLLDEEFSD